MQKDVMISIKGIQKVAGESGVIEMTTAGKLTRKADSIDNYTITYNEPDESGMENITTTLKIEGNDRLTLSRKGENSSQLIIEKGIRHLCHYETDFGTLMIGVFANRLDSTINDSGGELKFSYTLDINSVLSSENEIKIKVSEDKNNVKYS